MSILHGKLYLFEHTAPRGSRLPIDFFLRHLAQDQEEHAVAIILSGMGTDGTLGIKAIKEHLGLAMAQETRSAAYDSMPKSAIGTGLVDYVAPTRELPAKLLAYIQHKAAPSRPNLSQRSILSARRSRRFSPYCAPIRGMISRSTKKYAVAPHRTADERQSTR